MAFWKWTNFRLWHIIMFHADTQKYNFRLVSDEFQEIKWNQRNKFLSVERSTLKILFKNIISPTNVLHTHLISIYYWWKCTLICARMVPISNRSISKKQIKIFYACSAFFFYFILFYSSRAKACCRDKGFYGAIKRYVFLCVFVSWHFIPSPHPRSSFSRGLVRFRFGFPGCKCAAVHMGCFFNISKSRFLRLVYGGEQQWCVHMPYDYRGIVPNLSIDKQLLIDNFSTKMYL